MKRLWFLVALSLISLTGALIAYSGWLIASLPTIGVQWNNTGVIESQAVDALTAAPLTTQDVILAVNGVRVSELRSGLPDTVAIGDTVAITYQRNGQTFTRTFTARGPRLEEMLESAIGLPTATVAWLVGAILLLQTSTPHDQRRTAYITGAFFVLAAVPFAAGGIAQYGPVWLYRVYSTGFWALGALGTLAHIRFPRPYRIAKNRVALVFIALVAVAGTLWGALAPTTFDGAINRTAHTSGFAWFALNLALWIILLVWSWGRSPTLGERRQLGVVAVGGILALGPFLGVLVLPYLLRLPEIPGATYTLVSVALLPIAYGYAILRFRKMAQDRRMARLIVYAYTAVIVVIVFFLVMAFPGFKDIPRQSMIWIAALIGGVVAGPLMQAIDRWLSWLLFGRWTQPLQVAGDAMSAIDLRVERHDLSSQVREIISRQLQIHDSAVLLLDRDNRLYDPENSGLARAAEGIRVQDGSVLWRGLADNVWVREFDEIRSALLASGEQRAILKVPWARAVLPLRMDKKLTGLILVGYRTGVTFYDIDELIVLQLVAMSAAAAFHRRKLFIDLEGERDQASMLSQQIMSVRGEERKRVARDLHDDIIQPLIAHSYGLAVLEAPTAPGLRDNTLQLVEKIRGICAELRDPTLDTLGLGAAVRASVAAFQMRTQRKAELIVDQDPNASVPDAVASAALGVLQEALSNADKHSEARTIQVRVAIQPDVVRLNVRDDGRGFDVAEARKRAARTNHFGLLGADERVAAVGGAISVQSLPGHGTNIDVYLPLMPQLEG